jgi:ABC-type multidrug transport system ATPase subunit
LRYNAFKRNLGQSTRRGSGSKLSRRQSRYEGVEGWKDPDTDLKDVTSESSSDNLKQPLLGDGAPTDPTIPSGDASLAGSSVSSIGRRELKIDIGFKDLAVQLATGKKILNGVTGRLRAGRMTAIMGPSGCGKSTFLSALTNRIRDGGKTLGSITINGQARPLLSIQHLVGFVPQEDIMHRDLTVRENLRFYAHLKGNPNMSRPQRRAFVNEVIDILGLSHVQHSLIGDEETRGISGGQRKRVNIGIELMASPLVLFLDEPTSGLDSTMTQQLIDSLDKLAQLGLTIAMVIHQPRYEVLLKINDLLLLQKGGYPVYVGPTINALPYFNEFLGMPCPNRTTPADHFLDVISADPQLEHGNVCESWRWYVQNTDGANSNIEADPREFVDRVVPARSRPSRIYQTSYFFKRSFYQTMNTKVAYFTDCILLVFAGGMVGAVSVEEIQGYQLTMMTAGLIAVVSALKVFGPEKIVFLRETSAGVSTSAYFMGKAIAHLWQIALNPIFFLGLYYRTAYPSVAFWDMYKVILMTQFSCSGLGYLISASVATKNMQIAGVITGLIAVLLSGLNPTVRSLQSFIVGQFGLWCSYGSWTMGALLIKQTLGVVKSLYPIYCGELDK